MTARAMMNCGLYDLRIVKPKENHLSDKAISASSNAEDILYNAKIYQTTSDAIADLNIVYATTARSRNQIKNVYNADKATQILNEKLEQNQKCGIMFGPERTGLHNEDVDRKSVV